MWFISRVTSSHLLVFVGPLVELKEMPHTNVLFWAETCQCFKGSVTDKTLNEERAGPMETPYSSLQTSQHWAAELSKGIG
jgi:hypothetical protein